MKSPHESVLGYVFGDMNVFQIAEGALKRSQEPRGRVLISSKKIIIILSENIHQPELERLCCSTSECLKVDSTFDPPNNYPTNSVA